LSSASVPANANQDVILGIATEATSGNAWIPVVVRGFVMAQCSGEFQALQLAFRSNTTTNIFANTGLQPVGYALTYIPSTAGWGWFYIDAHLANMYPQYAEFVMADGNTQSNLASPTWFDTGFQGSIYCRGGYLEVEASCVAYSSVANNVLHMAVGINGETPGNSTEPLSIGSSVTLTQMRLHLRGSRRFAVTPGLITVNLWLKQNVASTMYMDRSSSPGLPRPRITLREVFSPANTITLT
jgi:hypothetical protein